MKRMKPWVAGVGLCALAIAPAAHALSTVQLDFEGAPDLGRLFTFYNGGIALPPSLTTGANLGVSFVGDAAGNATAPVEGRALTSNGASSVLFANSPTPFTAQSTDVRTVMQTGESGLSTNIVSMDYAAGMDLSSLSFWYSSQQTVTVSAYSGLGGSGSLLATYGVQPVFQDAGCRNAPGDETFCKWTFVDFKTDAMFASSMNLAAKSLVFGNDSLNTTSTLYDNVSFNSYTQAVPEPSTYALMALGLAGIAAISRRRRKET